MEKVYRNIEEQVEWLTEKVNKILQGLGGALPDPIEGPQGPQGPQGPRGNQGERGFSIIGSGTMLPDSARQGDMFILKKTTEGGVRTIIYSMQSGKWLPMVDITGSQGPQGEGGDTVYANPVNSEPSKFLNTIEINGVVYYASAISNLFEVISEDASYSGKFNSCSNYIFKTPLTSLEITELVDNDSFSDTWKAQFVAGSGFSLTLPANVSWKLGEPQFNENEEYLLFIVKSVDTGGYIAYIC